MHHRNRNFNRCFDGFSALFGKYLLHNGCFVEIEKHFNINSEVIQPVLDFVKKSAQRRRDVQDVNKMYFSRFEYGCNYTALWTS